VSQTWTVQSVLEQARAFQQSQPLLAAAELNLFEAIGDQAKTAREVADSLGTDPRATEVLLNALAALGLLEKADGTFRVPREVGPIVSGSSESGVLPMLQHLAFVAHGWDRLVEVVRTGRSNARSGWDRAQENQAAYRAFIQAMHVIGRGMADRIVAVLQPQRVRRALDVGGASGTYTIAMLRANPDLRATLFDLPPVVEMARERLQAEGLIHRVDLVAGDFYADPLPSGHDMVLLSAIIHQNSPSQNRDLYRKCFQALEGGGWIAIRDVVMDESHTRPVGGALFAINMLVNTEGGGTYSFSEIRSDLESAGFVDVRLLQSGEWMDGLVVAAKPGRTVG